MNTDKQRPGSERAKVVLVDAYSLIHRAFYALPPFETSSGEPTNAVLGFANMLLALLEDERPDYVAIAFDRSGPTFRDEMYEQYKANRAPMPDELRPQIARTEQLLQAMRLAVYGEVGFEADDIIGTLARQADERDMDVIIVTGDRDLLQLVTDNVHVLVTRRGIRDMERMDPAGVKERLGVPPERVADLKGLMGDNSDNIPGVPRIGPKTAERLLSEYDTLEDVLADADNIRGQVGNNLREYAEQARLSKQLSIIRTDAPATFDEERMRRQQPDMEAVSGLAAELEFTTLPERIRKQAGMTDAGNDADPASDEISMSLRVVETMAELKAAVRDVRDKLKKQPADDATAGLTVQIVATEDDAMRADIVGTLLAVDDVAVYVPTGHAEQPEELSWAAVRDVLAPLLTDASIPKSCHDAKHLRTLLRRHGTDLAGVTMDVMVASYLINPQGDHTLPNVSMRHLHRHLAARDQRLRDLGTPRKPARAAALAPAEVAAFVVEEADVIAELTPLLAETLQADGLSDLYRRVELPLIDVLLAAELRGVGLDREFLGTLAAEMDTFIDELTTKIHTLAGEQFNINSPRQLSKILFEKLQLPVVKRTKTGPSTDQEVLETLADEHDIAALLLDYRQVTKLKSTYVDALPSLVNEQTGRLHTNFNQTVTATGRLSSTNPNLQNIPVRTPEGRRIRKAFVPSERDWMLVVADYSQIELRILAHISGDDVLIDAFNRGEDIHTRTAAEVFEVDQDAVTNDMREAAKAINFGIVYGISSFGLARGTGLSRADAQKYIDEYFDRYPGVKEYVEKVIALGKEQGYVTTLLGRRRYLPDLRSRHWGRRSFAERTAMNTPIQGSAADIIKLAMVELHRRLEADELAARLLLQVHDELVLEVPAAELEPTVALIRDCMTNVIELSVPLVVDVAQGPNWLDTEPVTGPEATTGA